MSARQFCMAAVVAVAFGLAGTASAQGSLNWAANYPVAVNAPPGGANGSVKVLADYAIDQNWAMTGPTLLWQKIVNGKTEGSVQNTPLVARNGKVGAQDPNNPNNAIEFVQTLPKGTYQVWISAAYVWASPLPAPNPSNVLMATVVVQVTIN